MRKIIIIFGLIIILNSCELSIIEDFWYTDNSLVNILLTSPGQISDYVNDYVTYKKDDCDYSQTPYETQLRKKGDCEDKCYLALALNYKYLFIKGKMYLVDTSGDGKVNHAMYSIKGKMYNKTEAKGNKNYKIINTINFDKIPYMASNKRIK